MRESKIEKLLREGVESAGGMCEKFVSPEKAGVPDRIVTWPGEVHFVEMKKPGEAPEPHQLRDHVRRRALKQKVFVLDCEGAVSWYLNAGRHMEWWDYLRITETDCPSRAWILGKGQ